MTIQEALEIGKRSLTHISSGNLEAKLLLAHVTSKSKEYIFQNPQGTISRTKYLQLENLLKRRLAGEPVEHLIHRKNFYGRDFYVNNHVLIPRPETEEMVEEAISAIKNNQSINTIIDIGTGSGCIGITLSIELPLHQIIAVDVSSDALKVARRNKKTLNPNAKNIRFKKSDLLSSVNRSILKKKNLAIIANLPYIGTKKNHYISRETEQFEPHLALFGGEDGLDLHRKLLTQIQEMNLNIAYLAMEIGFGQDEEIMKILKKYLPSHQHTIKTDFSGFPRVTISYQFS